jgi:hypothetical protein
MPKAPKVRTTKILLRVPDELMSLVDAEVERRRRIYAHPINRTWLVCRILEEAVTLQESHE